jgi:PAS domain S-box-containing protein
MEHLDDAKNGISMININIGSRDTLDFRQIAEHACNWESWLTPDGKNNWTNDAVTRMTGRTPEQCMAMPDYPAPLVIADDSHILQRILLDAWAGGHGSEQKLHISRTDGATILAAVSWQAVKNTDGAVLGVRLSIIDLTDSPISQQIIFHDALSGLVRSGVLTSVSLTDAFQAITEAAAHTLNIARVGIWLMDDTRSSIQCRDMYDLPNAAHQSGTVVGRSSFPQYFASLDQDRVINADNAHTDPRTAELSAAYLTPLGIGALLDAPIVRDGRTVGVICHEQVGPARHWTTDELSFASSLADLAAMALEASERHELARLHMRLASILEATPDFVGTTDATGKPTYMNPAGRKLVKLAADESLEGWDVGDLYTPQARVQRDSVAIPTALRDGLWSGESIFQTRYREPFPVSQVLIAHKDEQGGLKFLSTVARDLRPWKQAQAALHERERFLATLVANLPGVAYRRRNEPGWPMEYISDGCLELTGYSAEAIMADAPNFSEVIHPQDRERVIADVEAALMQHRAFRVEYRILRADGTELWVWSKGRGIYDENGNVIAREGFIGDINDRVRAQIQLENLNAELEARVAERTARLAEVNQQLEAFAYSVSHDLKAPLRGIDGYSKLLLEQYLDQLPEEGRYFLNNIRDSTVRMNQLIEDLLAYSRLERRELSRIRVPLAKVIDRVMAEREIELFERGAGITVSVNDLAVLSDADALAQALRNLVDNALKFSRDSALPHIDITAARVDDKIVISVADNGCGFEMKYHDRIFDIFQRLHRVEDYPGTGVGLAIVRKAIERMGGKVWARSEPGAGATFFLELPA